jgi:hypothetical protein
MTLRRILIAIAVLLLLALMAAVALPWIVGAYLGPEELVGQTVVQPAPALDSAHALGRALRGYRDAMTTPVHPSVTQAQLATRSHLSATRISEIERGVGRWPSQAEQDSLTSAMWDLVVARYDTAAARIIYESLKRVLVARRFRSTPALAPATVRP